LNTGVTLKAERKLYEKLKRNCNKISWIRLENLSLSGTPDLLGYNANSHFFTVELKVTKSNKIRFSPHQIIKELDACGLALDPLRLGLDACCLYLCELGA
jgi:Holliday junction resolvase